MEIRAEKIQKAYGPTTVLGDISFSLERGQKVGLIGYNGTGKTTLLKILAGLEGPDSGEVVVRPGAVIGYMPQDTSLTGDETIRDYVRRVSGIADLEDRMEQSDDAREEYERRNGYSFDHRLDVLLSGFGIEHISSEKPISALSSGQKSKVFMAGVLLRDPDVFLLDEPTNNLDLPALIWLEDFLARTDAACVIVSHDRLFLDTIVRKIFEIDWQSRKLIITSGKYSDYLERKEKEKARLLRAHEDQKEEIQRLEEQARSKKQDASAGSRFMGSDNDKFARGFKRDRAGRSGKQAKAIEKRIEQMDIVDKPVERDAFRILLRPEKPEGARDIILKEVVAGHGNEGFRIGPLSLSIPYGSRIAILGLNGSGKTTLLRSMTGESPILSGSVVLGGGLVLGNLMQEHDSLPRGESIKNFLMQKAHLSVQGVFALSAKFGFKATEVDKPIAALSPGGRARLLFALFSSLNTNGLVLDEPTNHLDLEALEALEEAVDVYKGSIILVSHDRRFLERFHPTDVFVLADGHLVRQESFQAYVASAERSAKRLMNMI